jgi:hypothetical protein
LTRALSLAVLAAAMACNERADSVRFPGDTTGIVRPRSLHDLASVVRQLNAVVQADLRDISTDYDRCEGPRTVLHLAGVRSLLGSPHPDTMSLRVFGGPLPGGRYAKVSESPRYLAGRRYLLFLFNTDWRFSPVIGDLAFRIESAAGAEILISPTGLGVTGVSPLGVETRTRRLYLPEGLPGVGAVQVAPTPVAQLVPCGLNPDGSPRCPALPMDTAAPRETFPAAEPWTPTPPTREELTTMITPRQLVFKIDSVARTLGVTPGGYFAPRPRLECWNADPTREARP